ncbi:hypothetical protein [Paraburkholderia heleia]|uniref:hypothetical protein n=1 Tax=Paraburkholderia heleia TaxID=634127 RepID=UPI002AB7CA5E|nr:hypothetical protein [Paraburkholderia heleia]
MTMTQPGTQTPMRASLEAQALEAVLNGTQWLMAPTSGEQQEPDATDMHVAASRWKDEGRVFAIDRAGQSLYPLYLFDESGMPIPEVEEILRIFEGYPVLVRL